MSFNLASSLSSVGLARHVDLSVVVPVYSCAGTILPLHERLTRTLAALVGSYEIVFVDDRANDGSWQTLQLLAAKDPRVVACRMSRNVGQQLTITAGLANCCGDYAVVMDCDLQDPPETIPVLFAAARDGADIVFAKRKSGHQPASRRIANWLYFRLLGLVSGHRFDGELGAFSLISRRVIDAFLQFRERDRHYLMVLYDLGFETETIEYERETRSVGRSSYTLSKLIAHALDGMVFTTTRVLHGVIYTGVAIAGAGVVMALLVVLQWLEHGAAPGWTSVIVVQLLIGGVITLCLGVTGLYVGKIFEASRQRPLYFIQDRLDSSNIARMQPAETSASES
ncbi:dolichol-phosphate mannosyltransferase [Rhizobiales bacterium GAS113]|nr:dolichol-phosphate mannosyltransferase [Rhizobiales bacterium GAS113]